MPKQTPKLSHIEKDLLKTIEVILHRLHEIDEKLDHLIRTRFRPNGHHDPHNTTLNHFTG